MDGGEGRNPLKRMKSARRLRGKSGGYIRVVYPKEDAAAFRLEGLLSLCVLLAGTGEELVHDGDNGGDKDIEDEEQSSKGRSDDAFSSVSAMHLASPAVFATLLSSLLPCLGHATASSVRIAASEGRF